MEYSRDAAAATRGFDTTTGWFAACTMPQTQLLGVRRVARLGDEAQQYALRAWHRPAMTFVLGVARTGRVTTVALTRTAGSAKPDLAANLRLLVSAVDDLCPTSAGGRCSALPKAEPMSAPSAGELPMMLSEFDLPPVTGVQRPWMGTTPRRAMQNVAATTCDQSTFHGHGWRHDATRSFLIPGAHLADGVRADRDGRAACPRRARGRSSTASGPSSASCADRQLGTKVQRIAGGRDMTVWRVRTQVSDKTTVTFYMGVVRNGGAVAQVGFVPDRTHSMTTQQFVALVRRASERLGAMPECSSGPRRGPASSRTAECRPSSEPSELLARWPDEPAPQPASTWRISSAVSDGVLPTLTPTASRASCLAAAVPEEPETMAPAWPIVLPSGAVKPAT